MPTFSVNLLPLESFLRIKIIKYVNLNSNFKFTYLVIGKCNGYPFSMACWRIEKKWLDGWECLIFVTLKLRETLTRFVIILYP